MTIVCNFCKKGLSTTDDKIKEIIDLYLICPKTRDNIEHMWLREDGEL